MANVTYPVLTNTVPTGFCFNGFDSASWLEILSLMYVSIPQATGIIISATRPTPTEALTNAWLKVDASGYPERLYKLVSGNWLARHPIEPGHIILTAATSEASIRMLDRTGEADNGLFTVTTTTGPFWEWITRVDGVITHEAYEGKVPINPGTLTKSDGTTQELAALDTGGEVDHEITEAELPIHHHHISGLLEFGNAYDNDKEIAWGSGVSGATAPTKATDSVGSGTAHNTLPPYLALYLIRRTSRLFYVAQ